MKNVIGVSLGSHRQDFAFTTRFLGHRMNVRRLGADGDVERAAALLRHWEKRADAIGIGVAKNGRVAVGGDNGAAGPGLAELVTRVPVTTGDRLGDVFLEWALRRAQIRLGSFFNNARVLFLSGAHDIKLATAMSEYTDNLQFADPLRLGLPKLLTSLDALARFGRGAHYLAQWKPRRLPPAPLLNLWTDHVLRKAMQAATVVVAPVHELDAFGIEELAGKTIITSTVNDERIAKFRDKGVYTVIDGAPFMEGHALGPHLLEAMIVAATGKAPADLLEDDYLDIIAELQLEPRILYPNGFKRVNRFAFVIHPLSQEYFKNVKPIELLSRVSPPVFMNSLEKLLAYAPPMVYSRVTGIKSPTGVETEGWLITVGGTPREIMSRSPEFTYRRMLDAAKIARKLGAQIMGLGAFTKVVGDAGATVARRSRLPITTGNSYSASAALWAAHDALLRLQLLPRPKGKERAQFKAMVVGATGSIGAACARLLVKAAEEVYLVSPETAKLLALKESILKETPDAKVHLSARADRHLADIDMIVTATSGAGRKVLDIMKVKPGCVITDVARPLDLPPEEVAKRPDVLVIESGEIQLPGDVHMKKIGLPPGVAYACLAETIVLALEGRFERFTVGRAIEWEKVREIYQLGLKHGMKLAAISGVNGPFSDADFERVRTLALEARARQAAVRNPAPAKTSARLAGRALTAGRAAPSNRRARKSPHGSPARRVTTSTVLSRPPAAQHRAPPRRPR